MLHWPHTHGRLQPTPAQPPPPPGVASSHATRAWLLETAMLPHILLRNPGQTIRVCCVPNSLLDTPLSTRSRPTGRWSTRHHAADRLPTVLSTHAQASQPDRHKDILQLPHKHTLLLESHAATLSMEAMQLQGRPTPPTSAPHPQAHTPSTVQVVLLSGRLQHTHTHTPRRAKGSPCHRTHPHPNYAHTKAKGCAWVHTQATTTRGGTETTNQTRLCTPQRASATTWHCATSRKPCAAKT